MARETVEERLDRLEQLVAWGFRTDVDDLPLELRPGGVQRLEESAREILELRARNPLPNPGAH